MANQVKKAVAQAIARGCVVMTTKTKPIIPGSERPGGRQLVSVGPYRTAVKSSKKFIVIGRGWEAQHISAVGAAGDFIGFVGREQAWKALSTARCRGEKRNLQGKK